MLSGIRMGDDPLHQRYELRDQPRFQLGQPVLKNIHKNRALYLKRGNSADHFVVTGNLLNTLCQWIKL